MSGGLAIRVVASDFYSVCRLEGLDIGDANINSSRCSAPTAQGFQREFSVTAEAGRQRCEPRVFAAIPIALLGIGLLNSPFAHAQDET